MTRLHKRPRSPPQRNQNPIIWLRGMIKDMTLLWLYREGKVFARKRKYILFCSQGFIILPGPADACLPVTREGGKARCSGQKKKKRKRKKDQTKNNLVGYFWGQADEPSTRYPTVSHRVAVAKHHADASPLQCLYRSTHLSVWQS